MIGRHITEWGKEIQAEFRGPTQPSVQFLSQG